MSCHESRASRGQPHTEEQIRATRLVELKPLVGRIVLADYDPAWPRLFEREAQRVRAALGDRALSIDHVGSTAVPGLVAKPIIDMVLAVADSADEPAYVPSMEAAGYVLCIRDPDDHEQRLFNGPDTNINLHVHSHGCSEISRMLAFRDRLRASEADRERYASAKRGLAAKDWKYTQNYADAKTEVIAEILKRTSASPP